MRKRRSIFAVAVCLAASVLPAPVATASPPVLPPALWLSSADGADPDRLARYTDHGADAPDWSPDSSRLAFEGIRIFIVDVSSGERRRVTPKTAYDADPDWSPQGDSLAFARRDGPGGQGIYILDLTTGEERALTSGRDEDPDWSPDGTEITFSRYGRRRGIYVVDVVTGHQRKLVGDDARRPMWSPDGTWIAYSADDLFIVRPDGTGVTNLSRGTPPWHVSFDWSPDGSQLVFARGGSSLYLLDADGVGRKRLRPGIRGHMDNPWWSPDGRRILFDNSDRIFSIRPDGTRVRRITTGEWPALSPDGSRLAFLRD